MERDDLAGLEARLEGAVPLTAAFDQQLAQLGQTMLFTGREVGSLSSALGSGLRRAFDGAIFGGLRFSDAVKQVAASLSASFYNVAMAPIQNAMGGALANGVNALFSNLIPGGGATFSQKQVMPFTQAGGMGRPAARGGGAGGGGAAAAAPLPLRQALGRVQIGHVGAGDVEHDDPEQADDEEQEDDAEIGDELDRLYDAEPDRWQAFRTCFHAYLDLALRPDRRRILFHDAPAVLGTRAMEILMASGFAMMVADLSDLRAQGRIRPIPPEAVEAAARAITMALVLAIDDDTRALALTDDERKELSRAVIAAAISAWPHVALSTHVEEGRRIILPLPTEPADE